MTQSLKTIVLFFLLLGLVSAPVSSETLSGRVIDSETQRPLECVNLWIVETGDVMETDHQGKFVFKKIAAGSYRLVATHVGYDRSDTILISTQSSTPVRIQLVPSPWVLEGVVVTGTRSPHLLKDVPVQTEVVSQRDFRRTGATTVEEALQSAVGIGINSTDVAGSTASLRGVDKDRVLILVDGERLVGRVNGSIDLGQFALSNVEKIEVVKGTGSTLYGSDAMGGVINIITKKPRNNRKDVGLVVESGYFLYLFPTWLMKDGLDNYGLFPKLIEKNDYDNTNVLFNSNYAGNETGINLSGRYYHTDGFDLVDSTPHTNGVEIIDRYNIDGKFSKKLSSKWRWTNSFRFMHEKKLWIESEIWPGFTLVYDDDETNKKYSASSTFDYLSGDKYSMSMRFYGTYYDHDWNKIDQKTGTWVDTSHTDDVYYEFSYTSNYVIGENHVATYGFDYSYQGLESTELLDTNQHDRTVDVYLQYEHSPIKSLNILPGIRYERHSASGSHVNPSINVMFSPTQNFKLRGFVGRGFRAPSLKQSYFVFDHSAAGYIVFGGSNDLPPDIIPIDGFEFKPLTLETSINSSISAEISYGVVGLHRITYFYNHLDDLIEFTYIGSSPKYWRGIYVYQNIERAITQGIEWDSKVRLSSALDFSFSFNYLYTRDLNTQEELINSPGRTFKFFVTWFEDDIGLGATIWGDFQSSKLWVPRSNTGGNEGAAQYAPARSQLSTNLFYRFGNGLETFLRVENILDEVDVNYGYWPGRSFHAGIKYDLNFSN